MRGVSESTPHARGDCRVSCLVRLRIRMDLGRWSDSFMLFMCLLLLIHKQYTYVGIYVMICIEVVAGMNVNSGRFRWALLGEWEHGSVLCRRVPRAMDGSVWTVRGMEVMCGREKAIGKGEYCSDRKQFKEVFFHGEPKSSYHSVSWAHLRINGIFSLEVIRAYMFG